MSREGIREPPGTVRCSPGSSPAFPQHQRCKCGAIVTLMGQDESPFNPAVNRGMFRLLPDSDSEKSRTGRTDCLTRDKLSEGLRQSSIRKSW